MTVVPGSFATIDGVNYAPSAATNQLPCFMGTYSVNGTGPCMVCDAHAMGCGGTSPGGCNAGYESTDNGATCTACMMGFYKPFTGNMVCTMCPLGQTTFSTGAASPIDCVNGGGSACNPGMYRLNDMDPCIVCDMHATDCGGTSPGVCSAGFYRSIDGSCMACVAGTYKATVGNDGCITVPAGQFPSVDGITYASSGATQSVVCPIGTECVSGNAPTPNPSPGNALQCGAGFYLKNKSTSHESCAACPAGKFSTDRTMRNRRCKKCRVNSYAAHAGASGCTICPTGFSTSKQSGKKQCFRSSDGKSMRQLHMII